MRKTLSAVALLIVCINCAAYGADGRGEPWAYPYPVPEKGFGIYTWWDDNDAFNSYYYWDEEGRLRRFWSAYDVPDEIVYDPAAPEAVDPAHEDALQAHDQDGDGVCDWDEIEAGTGADDPEDHPQPQAEAYDPTSTTQDIDGDGIPNATDPDDDNDGHLDANADPDADGNKTPDDIEDLIKKTVENLGDATLDEVWFMEDQWGPIQDNDGNYFKCEKFVWQSFKAGVQLDSRHDPNDPFAGYYAHIAALADSGASGGEAGKLEWRLACVEDPWGRRTYYWEFMGAGRMQGEWQPADQFFAMPKDLPFLPTDPAYNSIGLIADPDQDNQSNGLEGMGASDPLNGTVIYTPTTDADGDGWGDQHEATYGSSIYDSNSHPVNDVDYWDTVLHRQTDTSGDFDGDGYANNDEAASGSSPTNPYSRPTDSDGDGRPDAVEAVAGTNPHNGADHPPSTWYVQPTVVYDTDGDGHSNGQEQQAGSNPQDGDDTPADLEPDVSPDTEESEFSWQTAQERATAYMNRITKIVDPAKLKNGTASTDVTVRLPTSITPPLSIHWTEYTIHLDPDDMEEGWARSLTLSIRSWIRMVLKAMLAAAFAWQVIALLRDMT